MVPLEVYFAELEENQESGVQETKRWKHKYVQDYKITPWALH